jgi:flagellar biosynthesis protein FlhF
MEATRFEAISMRDAIKKVKEELGKDAVIVSTREREKALNIGGKPQKIIEVLATPAASSSSNPMPLLKAQSKPLIHSLQTKPYQQSSGAITKPVFPRIENREKATVIRSNSASSTLPPIAQSSSSGRNLDPTTPQKQTQPSPNSSISAASQQASQAAHHASIQDVQRELQGQIEQLKSALRGIPQINLSEQVQEMKILLHDILRSSNSNRAEEQLHPEVEEIAIRLRSAGVLPSFISELTRELQEIAKSAPEGSTIQGAYGVHRNEGTEPFLTATIKYILKSIRVTNSAFGSTGTQEMHCFVGPSGAGKTTSIAKIGASLVAKKGLKVALVTMDTLKVGASEQLRVFSKILGMEFAEVRDVTELEAFAQKRYDIDIILIDTSGRPTNSKSQLDFLRDLLSASLPIRFHLVLASTMKNRDLEETARTYQFINPSSITFSKLDESWSFGEIFNITSLFKIPLSYFATGPSVPDDLEPATKERVVERLLRI